MAQGVGDEMAKLKLQRIAIDQGCVVEPISYGVALSRSIDGEGGVGDVEIESLELWQRVRTIAIEEREAVGFGALALEE